MSQFTFFYITDVRSLEPEYFFLEQTKNEEMYGYILMKTQQDGSLQMVKNFDHEIILTAIKNNGINLEFIKNLTEEMCMEAVK